MSYEKHLRRLILAHLRVHPHSSQRGLSRAAGLGENWVASFLRTGSAQLGAMDRIARTIGELCPSGPQGDDIRGLMARMADDGMSSPVELDQGDAA